MTERISPLLVDKKEKTMIVFEFFFFIYHSTYVKMNLNKNVDDINKTVTCMFNS